MPTRSLRGCETPASCAPPVRTQTALSRASNGSGRSGPRAISRLRNEGLRDARGEARRIFRAPSGTRSCAALRRNRPRLAAPPASHRLLRPRRHFRPATGSRRGPAHPLALRAYRGGGVGHVLAADARYDALCPRRLAVSPGGDVHACGLVRQRGPGAPDLGRECRGRPARPALLGPPCLRDAARRPR